MTAIGLGALTGALFIASFSQYLSRGKLLTLGMLFYPVAIILFTVSRFLPLSLIFLLISGTAMVTIYNLCNALVQIQTPENIRGRVMSIYSFVFLGLMPFAALWIGAAASHLGENCRSRLHLLFFSSMPRQFLYLRAGCGSSVSKIPPLPIKLARIQFFDPGSQSR